MGPVTNCFPRAGWGPTPHSPNRFKVRVTFNLNSFTEERCRCGTRREGGRLEIYFRGTSPGRREEREVLRGSVLNDGRFYRESKLTLFPKEGPTYVWTSGSPTTRLTVPKTRFFFHKDVPSSVEPEIGVNSVFVKHVTCLVW